MAPIPLLALALWCAALCVCDLRARRLPDTLTLPGAALVLAYGFTLGAAIPALLGATLLTFAYLLVHLANPGALGAGDVKLAVGLGAATALGGASTWTWAALAAPIITAVAALGTLSTSCYYLRWSDGNAGIGALVHENSTPRSSNLAEPGQDSSTWSAGSAETTAVICHSRTPDRQSRLPVAFATDRWSRACLAMRSWTVPERAGVVAGTVAHGPAMCVASVIALAAGR